VARLVPKCVYRCTRGDGTDFFKPKEPKLDRRVFGALGQSSGARSLHSAFSQNPEIFFKQKVTLSKAS